MESDKDRAGALVLGSHIDALSWDEVLRRLAEWAARRESRYVCVCNVHVTVTASRNPAFREIINRADMATPDGAPVAWLLRRMGFADQQRINGPDLMWHYCALAERASLPIFLYGSTEETLGRLVERLQGQFPRLVIAGAVAPPFRSVAQVEDSEVIERINGSGAGMVFVGLGCPKQEEWMALHRGRIHAVMVGVGAAFDYHAGTVKRAPEWMQHHGIEWLHRVIFEPRRLWRRYLVTNTLFVLGVIPQLLHQARMARRAPAAVSAERAGEPSL